MGSKMLEVLELLEIAVFHEYLLLELLKGWNLQCFGWPMACWLAYLAGWLRWPGWLAGLAGWLAWLALLAGWLANGSEIVGIVGIVGNSSVLWMYLVGTVENS